MALFFFSTHRTAVAIVGIIKHSTELEINGIIYWPLVHLLCTVQVKPALFRSLIISERKRVKLRFFSHL